MKSKCRGCLTLMAFFLSLPVLLYLVLYLCNDTSNFDQDSFDPETSGIVKVMTVSDGGMWHEPGTFFYTLADHKRIQSSDAFEPNKMSVYDASSSTRSYIENGKVANRVSRIRVLDENNKKVPVTQEFGDIVHLASQINHDIMVLKILKTEAHTFVYTELNVNLWTPCTLYSYNPETRSLAEIYEWDDQKVTAIKVLNPELLSKLSPSLKLPASKETSATQ